MAGRSGLALVGGLIAILSCTRAPATPTPAPGSGPAAAPGPRAQPEAPSGIVTLPPRRIPPSRDSLAKLRTNYITQVMRDIAGREKEPAEQVFKNVQVLKGISVDDFMETMGIMTAALQFDCSDCHANAGTETVRISVTVTQKDPPTERELVSGGAFGLGADAPAGAEPGHAYFTLASGRHVDVTVQRTLPKR